ncbi:hypothetical protein QBC41DRAFT_28376 [Cercophora samala]|uniref:Uncharacterized protein n=1 Tax=Cercophora samala TaxID=330535 RepID=A0AA39Z1M5_9PEZI|nr:hypothetical protein QBC41DRAFT_28376 [Cercophora samala]
MPLTLCSHPTVLVDHPPINHQVPHIPIFLSLFYLRQPTNQIAASCHSDSTLALLFALRQARQSPLFPLLLFPQKNLLNSLSRWGNRNHQQRPPPKRRLGSFSDPAHLTEPPTLNYYSTIPLYLATPGPPTPGIQLTLGPPKISKSKKSPGLLDRPPWPTIHLSPASLTASSDRPVRPHPGDRHLLLHRPLPGLIGSDISQSAPSRLPT